MAPPVTSSAAALRKLFQIKLYWQPIGCSAGFLSQHMRAHTRQPPDKAHPSPHLPRAGPAAAVSGTGHRCVCHRSGGGRGAAGRKSPSAGGSSLAGDARARPVVKGAWRGQRVCEAVAASCGGASPRRDDERRSSLPPASGKPPSRLPAAPSRRQGGGLPTLEERRGTGRKGTATTGLTRARRYGVWGRRCRRLEVWGESGCSRSRRR